MSRRGRTTGAAISLFSFQDIITSVTAILILLVLILTLELITRTKQRGIAADDRRMATQLRKSVEDMERQAEALRAEIATLQSSAKLMAAFSETEVRQRARDADARTKQLTQEIELLETELRTAALSRRRTEAKIVADHAAAPEASAAHVAALTARAAEMEEANRTEQERQKTARTSTHAHTTASTFIFNAPPGETLAPHLVEVSGDGLAVLEKGGSPPRRFTSPGRKFDHWLASLDATTEYVVIILRPSGVSSYDAVEQALKTAGVAMGAELVGEATNVSLGDGR